MEAAASLMIRSACLVAATNCHGFHQLLFCIQQILLLVKVSLLSGTFLFG